jgi:hypothetical protein
MRAYIVRGFCVACVSFIAASTSRADEPQQEPEQLPPPKQVLPLQPPAILHLSEYPVVPSLPPRMDSRAGWAYFAPNSMGQMRPRVVVSPYGDYYLYNGERFYGRTTRSTYTLPMTADQATLPLSGGR